MKEFAKHWPVGIVALVWEFSFIAYLTEPSFAAVAIAASLAIGYASTVLWARIERRHDV
jgi:hypothetical protein